MSSQLNARRANALVDGGASDGAISPGKRTLTQGIQRKASSEAVAPVEAAPAAPASPSSSFEDPFSLHLASPVVEVGAVQREALGAASAGAIQEAAGRGVSTPSSSLPYAEAIQASFGPAHDLSGVQAHQGGAASAACDDMNALAFATGNHVVFSGAPSLHTAAHEAAHIVQQRAGVHLKSGVGEVGDFYERNADEVADRVVAGLPAHDLLPAAPTSASSGAVQQQPVQRYTKMLNTSGLPYDTLSDDGKLAVLDHGKVGWAEASMIDAANKALAANKAKAKVKAVGSGDVTVAPPNAAPGAATTTLKQFSIVDGSTNGELQLPDDCGGANQQLLGSEARGNETFVAAHKNGSTEEYTRKEGYHADDLSPGGDLSTTEVLSGDIYIRIFEREFGKKLSREDALKEWKALRTKDKAKTDELSKKYGINDHAVPKMGQGVTISSERDMPGSTGRGYNFHFAYNLMASGADYLTLEDYDSSGVAYYLDMYGPESKNQAFNQDSGNTTAVDHNHTAMVVQHADSINGSISADATQLVDDPATFSNSRALGKGDKVTMQRKGQSWTKVAVTSGKHSGQVGWIMNQFYTPS